MTQKLSLRHGVKGLNVRILLFILLNSVVMKPHKTKAKTYCHVKNIANA